MSAVARSKARARSAPRPTRTASSRQNPDCRFRNLIFHRFCQFCRICRVQAAVRRHTSRRPRAFIWSDLILRKPSAAQNRESCRASTAPLTARILLGPDSARILLILLCCCCGARGFCFGDSGFCSVVVVVLVDSAFGFPDSADSAQQNQESRKRPPSRIQLQILHF